LGAGAGFEPAEADAQLSGTNEGWKSRSSSNAQLSAQTPGTVLHELDSVVAAWPKLKLELRAAVLAIVASVDNRD